MFRFYIKLQEYILKDIAKENYCWFLVKDDTNFYLGNLHLIFVIPEEYMILSQDIFNKCNNYQDLKTEVLKIMNRENRAVLWKDSGLIETQTRRHVKLFYQDDYKVKMSKRYLAVDEKYLKIFDKEFCYLTSESSKNPVFIYRYDATLLGVVMPLQFNMSDSIKGFVRELSSCD